MPALKNTKHERFAQELAKGETADAAYETAGYAANRGNAIRLKANESISARVAEIKERAAERAEISVASLTKELLDILAEAKKGDTAGHLNAARQSVMDVAKLNGLVVDKADTSTVAALTVTYVSAPSGPAPQPSPEDYETEE